MLPTRKLFSSILSTTLGCQRNLLNHPKSHKLQEQQICTSQSFVFLARDNKSQQNKRINSEAKKKTTNPIRSTGDVKVANLKVAPGTQFADLPVIIVKSTANNTLLYLLDHKGVTSTWTSAGIEGFKNAKRGTSYAAKVASESLATRALDLGVRRVRLKLKGIGMGRMESMKGLVAKGLEIVSMTDVTPVPHNGPKPRKKRRL